MGKRYEHEAPGFIKCLFLLWTDRLIGTKTPLEWIVDKQSGQRFPIDESESALLQTLGDHLQVFAAIPRQERGQLIDQTFDALAEIFADRRDGNAHRFEELLQWETKDWANWCNEELAALSHRPTNGIPNSPASWFTSTNWRSWRWRGLIWRILCGRWSNPCCPKIQITVTSNYGDNLLGCGLNYTTVWYNYGDSLLNAITELRWQFTKCT